MNEEKTAPGRSGGGDASSLADAALAANAPMQKSWGEKYGAGTLAFTRNWVINYFINFTIGAVAAYKWDTSNSGKKLETWIEETSDKSTMVSKATAKYVLRLVTRNQFLLMGGHALLPILKVIKDHEQALTFWTEHKLDQLQKFLGRSNAATERNLAEHEHVQKLIDAGKHSEIKELSDDDKELLAKHHVNEHFHFQEQRLRWWTVIKARLIGMTFSTAASGGLGWLSGQKYIPILNYKPRYEEPFGRWVRDNIITKTPGLRSYFAQESHLIGEYFLADAILTTVSAGVYRAVESMDEKKDAKKRDAQEATASQSEIPQETRHVVRRVKHDGAIAPAVQERSLSPLVTSH